MLSRWRTLCAKPRSICERITPLLPRAPSSEPCAAAPATTESGWSQTLWASRSAALAVRNMFDPVSPSGTGNTLRSFRTPRYFRKK